MPKVSASEGMNSAPQPGQQAVGIAQRQEFDQRAGTGQRNEGEGREPGGRELGQERARGRENHLAGVVTGLAAANSAQEQDGPEPGNNQQDVGDIRFVGELGNDQPGGDGVPPPALSFQEQFQFGDE